MDLVTPQYKVKGRYVLQRSHIFTEHKGAENNKLLIVEHIVSDNEIAIYYEFVSDELIVPYNETAPDTYEGSRVVE